MISGHHFMPFIPTPVGEEFFLTIFESRESRGCVSTSGHIHAACQYRRQNSTHVEKCVSIHCDPKNRCTDALTMKGGPSTEYLFIRFGKDLLSR